MMKDLDANNESAPGSQAPAKPLLKITRPTFVNVTGKILDTTSVKLEKYVDYASEALGAKCTTGDVLENALSTFFDRDTGFKNFLKQT